MKVNHYKSDVTDPRRLENPVDVIIENCDRLNRVLMYMSQLKPRRVNDYVIALEKRLRDEIKEFHIDHSSIDFDEILRENDQLKRYSELVELMIQFVFHQLHLPSDYTPESKEIEVSLLNWLRSSNVFRYYRVMAIIDIMERNDGIQLWKDMMYRANEDFFKNSEEEVYSPIKEITEGWKEHGEKGESTFELTVVSYDNHKVALRFDICPVFESVKHLEDREVAFLSYCGGGEPEKEFNHWSRRTDYCVEFYWNNEVHPDAQPPSHEFWEKLAEKNHPSRS
ncbi:MAG: hypothetical protein ACXAAK_10085 [Candidatus Thorarchaeota archaeon]